MVKPDTVLIVALGEVSSSCLCNLWTTVPTICLTEGWVVLAHGCSDTGDKTKL